MKIVIVGAGAIGMLIGAYLSRGGNEVIFVERDEETVAAINRQGIGLMESVSDEPGTLVFESAKAVTDAQQITDCKTVIMAVKSFDTRSAIKSVVHLVTNDSPVLTIQTGLGNLEVMEQVVDRENILGGFTYMAGAALGPGRVRIGGHGRTFIGELNDKKTNQAKNLCTLLNNCGLTAELVPRIIEKIWCKVLVYSAINPISGLLRIKNGRLLDKMESISLAKRLIDEGRQVAESCGIDLSDINLYDLFFETCKATSENISSMLLDLLRNRKTEIDSLNGEIISLGQDYDLSVPTHMTIMELIKLNEKITTSTQISRGI